MSNVTKSHASELNVGVIFSASMLRKDRLSLPYVDLVCEPIEGLDLSKIQYYSIELKSLETELSDGVYNVVMSRCGLLRDGTIVEMYQKTKARISVRNGKFLRHTIREACRECVAIDPHHCFLEKISIRDPKTVWLQFGS